MKTLQEFLKQFSLDNLSINAGFLKAKINFRDADKHAAWEMYIELLTRVATQHLQPDSGDEKTALSSIFSLFNITREIIKKNGTDCIEFTKVAVVILNQIVRPFTSKWHKLSLTDEFQQEKIRLQFREELLELQKNLRNYTSLLADMAGVENLTDMEKMQ